MNGGQDLEVTGFKRKLTIAAVVQVAVVVMVIHIQC